MPNPTWTYDGFGTFVAQLIAQPGEACADTLLQEIAVLPQDPLVMAFGAIEPLACSLETDVDFFFYGDYADAVTWDFGAAGSASGDTIQFDFGESGLYPVTLTIENDTCGTVQTAEFEVYVPELVAEVELVIPNVLTPNADGERPVPRGHPPCGWVGGLANASSFAQFKLQVYDRWGVIVHESEALEPDGMDARRITGRSEPITILEADHAAWTRTCSKWGGHAHRGLTSRRTTASVRPGITERNASYHSDTPRALAAGFAAPPTASPPRHLANS